MVLDLGLSSHIVSSTEYLHHRILQFIFVCHKWLRMKTRSTVQCNWLGSEQQNGSLGTNSRVHCVVPAGCGQALRRALAAGVYWGDSGGTAVAAANQAGDGESQNAGSEGPRPVHPKSWQLRWILTKGAFISSTVFPSLSWTLEVYVQLELWWVCFPFNDWYKAVLCFGHMYTVL